MMFGKNLGPDLLKIFRENWRSCTHQIPDFNAKRVKNGSERFIIYGALIFRALVFELSIYIVVV